jgi:hypothetical protein
MDSSAARMPGARALTANFVRTAFQFALVFERLAPHITGYAGYAPFAADAAAA